MLRRVNGILILAYTGASELIRSRPADAPWWTRRQEFKTVRSDTIEDHMTYAKDGSDIPLKGIWWMDQRLLSSIGKTPEYKNELPGWHMPSEDLLSSYKDWPIEWNAKERTLGPIPNGAGKTGHWAYTNGVKTRVELYASILRMFATFRFNKKMDFIHCDYRLKFGRVRRQIPEDMFKMVMKQKPWGWDRITTVGPANFKGVPQFVQTLLKKALPSVVVRMIESGEEGAFHYPVLQIVDGQGKRTKFYDQYVRSLKTPGYNFASDTVLIPTYKP